MKKFLSNFLEKFENPNAKNFVEVIELCLYVVPFFFFVKLYSREVVALFASSAEGIFVLGLRIH